MSKDKKKKRTFQVRLTYFKPSGAYYTHEVVEWDGHVDEYNCPLMREFVAHARGLRDHGTLPGLEEGLLWDGPVLVELESREAISYPTLIMNCEGK